MDLAKLTLRPTALARYGDGEFSVMMGSARPVSRKSQSASELLRLGLIETVVNPQEYIYGMQPMAKRDPSVHAWIDRHSIDIPWVNGDFLLHMSRRGDLYPFIRWLKRKYVVLVGPKRLLPMGDHFWIRDHVDVPLVECWDMTDRIVDDMVAYHGPERVFLVTAGPSAPVIIYRAWPSMRGAWLISCGSLWDTFIGVHTAAYQLDMTDETRERNLHG